MKKVIYSISDPEDYRELVNHTTLTTLSASLHNSELSKKQRFELYYNTRNTLVNELAI